MKHHLPVKPEYLAQLSEHVKRDTSEAVGRPAVDLTRSEAPALRQTARSGD